MLSDARPGRVLIVDDDPDLTNGLRLNLEIDHNIVAVEGTGSRASSTCVTFGPDLIIFEPMLSGTGGLELVKNWHNANDETRIIIATRHSVEADRIAAFRLGADDFVTKPISVMELLERVRCQLRRRLPHLPGIALKLGQVTVDLAARVVRRNGNAFRLAEKEFSLLSALLAARGKPVSREVLLREVWGHKRPIDTRTVEFHIARLRRLIESDTKQPQFIITVPKVGYRIQTQP